MTELIYTLARHWKKRKTQREKEAQEFSEEQSRRNNLNIIRALLLYLPSEQASMLRYIFMNNGHGAYIPIEEESAQKLREQGCLTKRTKEELRGWGYEYASKCYYYRVSSEIAEYLNEHLKELGHKWGTGIEVYERLKKYQRAGKSLHLE